MNNIYIKINLVKVVKDNDNDIYYFVFFQALSGHNYNTLPIIPMVSILIGIYINHWIIIMNIFDC